MAELLLELFSEEIPARMQQQAATALSTAMVGSLKEAGFEGFSANAYATPRRLALVITDLDAAQPDRREERKGPRVGAPDKALEGFLKSTGLTKDDLTTQSDKKGEFYVAVIEQKGRPTAEVISDLVPQVVRDFHWPKSMRWGDGALRWVRPLHSILCLFDGEIVSFDVDGVKSGNTTHGHRFMAPEAITVSGYSDYVAQLETAKVMLNMQDRRSLIAKEAKELATNEDFELVDDEALLDETAGLVEWPVVLMGSIDEAFVKPVTEGGLPPEVLTSAMAKHQKYFSVRDPKSQGLAPRFVVVSNLIAEDGGKKIIAGNERVLRARLSDAKFFWDKDRQATLETRVDALSKIIFHAKLGTVREKVARIEALAAHVAGLTGADTAQAKQASLLAKADLSTEMVGEFADLQGLMGKYYAEADGETQEVAAAVHEHYSPLGPSDQCPSAPVSVAVAIADKIDSLVGFFGIDEKPTGSKDPYALRRAALGIVRLVLENKLRLSLRGLFAEASKELSDHLSNEKAADELLSFFADRLKVYLKDKGARHDLIDAVFALPGQDDLLLIVERVEALSAFLDSDDGANLLTAYKRAANILRIEEKKDKATYGDAPDASLFQQAEEKNLSASIAQIMPEALRLAEAEDFTGAMAVMAGLRGPVDAFFDTVTVNTDEQVHEQGDVRRNRLRLLSEIRSALESVANFSKIEG